MSNINTKSHSKRMPMSLLLMVSTVLFLAMGATAQKGDTVIWQLPTAQVVNMQTGVDPDTGDAIVLAVEGFDLVSRQLKTGQQLWSQPLNFSYDSQQVEPSGFIEAVGSQAVVLYISAIVPQIGSFIEFSYRSTYSIASSTNGSRITKCGEYPPNTGPAVDPSSNAIFTSAWAKPGIEVSRFDGLSKFGCIATHKAVFPSSTGGASGGGLTPVLISNNGQFASITTQVSTNNTDKYRSLITRFNPSNLQTVWQAASPIVSGCEMGLQSSLTPNILVSATPASSPDIYASFVCQNTSTQNVVYKVNGQGQVVGSLQHESVSGTGYHRGANPVFFALINSTSSQQAPCFEFTGDLLFETQCFSPSDDLTPLFGALPSQLNGMFPLGSSGGYLWYYKQQTSLQGYTLEGLFAVPPSPSFVASAVSQVSDIYQIEFLSSSPPLALLNCQDGLALIELAQPE